MFKKSKYSTFKKINPEGNNKTSLTVPSPSIILGNLIYIFILAR
ncbi:hypothetical protein LLB_2322 [Legionella longbeachae D-4968]|nr:hypothetical protein LLB_2322 [Legionella longbeachae D-4968]